VAHFVNSRGARISNGIVNGGRGLPLTIGVYGADGLSVGPNDPSIAGIARSGGADKYGVTWFQLTGKRPGNVMVEAKMAGSVWDFFQLKVGEPTYLGAEAAWAMGPPRFNGCYTQNPNEVPTKRTTPAPGDVVTFLHQAWSDLTEVGARTLTAQFMHETGNGQSCYNWNLGNVKCKPTETTLPHMYLKNTWELLAPAAALKLVTESQGLGFLATEDEIRAHKWSRRGGTVIAVFEPPHYIARFKAYASLAEGAQRWMSHHRGVASRFSGYLAAVNAGDCVLVANILFRAHYYTGSEGDYARNMTAKKAQIDRQLGSARS
jgi:hypothetical protein